MIEKYGFTIARIVAALLLLVAGGGKLAGLPELHLSFSILGLPGWFGYFIGACEVAAAIGLFIRPLTALAALGVSLIMLGAIYFHIMHTPLASGIPSVILLGLCIFIFMKKKSEILKF